MSRFISIIEVGPRDGLQNEQRVLDVQDRLEFISRLDACGVQRMEVVSFVNPKRVPQMAGAEEIMATLPAAKAKGRIGLVLNDKGWTRAVAAGCDEANIVVCASEGFGIRNQGSTPAEQMASLAQIMAQKAVHGGPSVTMTLSVAFGCPFDGEVSQDQVVALTGEAARLGVDEIAIADTIGAADPWMVRRRIEAVRKVIGDIPLRLHFHDTRNTGLANAYAGVEAGIDRLDASCGGIGGCPFAPNATGNIGTEDLVNMLHRGGYDTGLDLEGLITTAGWICDKLGKTAPSSLTRAGAFALTPAP
jgi:hydroxymethylglutaryl-CoA lyase